MAQSFLQQHKTLDELCVYKPKIDILDDILNSANQQKLVDLKTQDGRVETFIASAQTISLDAGVSAFCIDLKSTQNDAVAAHLPILRLPEISSNAAAKGISMEINLHDKSLDEKWLSQTQFLLELSRAEFVRYLKSFIQSALRQEISLQNSVISNDTASIKRIAKKLAKVATNLHITSLAQIYESIANAHLHEQKGLLVQVNIYIGQLNSLLQRESQ